MTFRLRIKHFSSLLTTQSALQHLPDSPIHRPIHTLMTEAANLLIRSNTALYIQSEPQYFYAHSHILYIGVPMDQFEK